MRTKKKNETPREVAAQHTAGPWVREGDHIIGGRYVCELANWHITAAGGSYDAINAKLTAERDANARLIAAAPDLLAALEDAVKWADKAGIGFPCWLVLAECATSAATGASK